MANFEHGTIAHFDIAGHDGETLGAFYKDIFNWKIDPKGPGYSLIETDDQSPNGAIVEAEQSSVTVGVTVSDLHETLSKVSASGGKVVMPETDNGWVKKAQISDPAGNIMTLIEL